MPQYEISYAYNPANRILAFENKEPLNNLIVEKAINRTSPLAEVYNVFGYMKINHNGKFKVTALRALPLALRACSPCSWDPIISKVVRSEEITPCCVEGDYEFCPQTELDALFNNIINLEAEADGSVRLAKEAEFVALIADLWADGVSQAYNGILAEGKIYDGVTVGWSAVATTADQTNFPKTANVCRGYARLFKDLSATITHLNVSDIFITTVGATQTVNRELYTGNPVDAIEALKAAAKPELQDAINQGFYMTGDGNQLTPFILCDRSFFNRVVDYYQQTVGILPTMVQSPITVENMSVPFKTRNGSTVNKSIPVYMIYGLPVIFDPNLNSFDVFKKGYLHFLAITVSNNIQLGTSLGRTDLGIADPPVKMQKAIDLKDKGKVYMTTSMFAATALAAPEYAVSSQLLVTWT